MKPEKENYFQVSPARMHNSEITFTCLWEQVKNSYEFKFVDRHEKFSVATATSEATEEDRGPVLARQVRGPLKYGLSFGQQSDKQETEISCSFSNVRFCETAESFVKSVYLHGTTRPPMN